MTGICGNYDYNAVNDLRTAAGQQMPGNSAGYKQIGDSWKVYDPENPRCVNNDYQTPNCPKHVLARVRSRYYCGLLLEKNGPFRACATKLDMKKFSEACEQDVCAAYPNGRLMKAMACNALENVEKECKGQGSEVTDWRRLSGCSSAPQYGPWSAWGKCSGGLYRCYQVRTRECLSGDCKGPFSQRRSCICGGDCAGCSPNINNRCYLPHPTTCTQFYVCYRWPIFQQVTRPPVTASRVVATRPLYTYRKSGKSCPPRTGWNNLTKKCEASRYPCRYHQVRRTP